MKGWCVCRTMHEDSVAHIYGHHVHMAVNHICGPLNPYVHFSRHVRHFPSQLWLMLRLPQWWRLRRLQLRLIRGGPVDADKKISQNRKKEVQNLPLAKKVELLWRLFGCKLCTPELHIHPDSKFLPPWRGLSARGVGHVHGRCPVYTWSVFFWCWLSL